MYNCDNYCNDPLDNHSLNDCGLELLGSSDSAILLECNHTIDDPSNATQVAANIAAGKAHLVKNVKIGFGAPSPITVESNVGGGNPKVVNYDRKGTYVDGNVSASNVDFYKPIFAGRKFGGLIIREKGAADSGKPQVTWIDREVTFTGGRILPTGNNEFQRFECEFVWRNLYDADIYTEPAGIF